MLNSNYNNNVESNNFVNRNVIKSKINNQLCWKPSLDFEQGLKITIQWYLNNKNWLSNIADGSYMNLKNHKL